MAEEEITGAEQSRERIIPINIEEEMKSAYIDYSMSVIVSRALPDVRDGLKPVHRRLRATPKSPLPGSRQRAFSCASQALGRFYMEIEQADASTGIDLGQVVMGMPAQGTVDQPLADRLGRRHFQIAPAQE